MPRLRVRAKRPSVRCQARAVRNVAAAWSAHEAWSSEYTWNGERPGVSSEWGDKEIWSGADKWGGDAHQFTTTNLLRAVRVKLKKD